MWYEEIPKDDSENLEEEMANPEPYEAVANQVGITLATILKDITGFYPLKDEEKI